MSERTSKIVFCFLECFSNVQKSETSARRSIEEVHACTHVDGSSNALLVMLIEGNVILSCFDANILLSSHVFQLLYPETDDMRVTNPQKASKYSYTGY